MNVVAFETLLAQEWTRSGRYHRPLGLLLLELEEATSDGGRRPLDRQAPAATRWTRSRERVREADTVAQLSPSRFAVICPESSPGSVETLAHALESSLEAGRCTRASASASGFESDRGPADLVSRAAARARPAGDLGRRRARLGADGRATPACTSPPDAAC